MEKGPRWYFAIGLGSGLLIGASLAYLSFSLMQRDRISVDMLPGLVREIAGTLQRSEENAPQAGDDNATTNSSNASGIADNTGNSNAGNEDQPAEIPDEEMIIRKDEMTGVRDIPVEFMDQPPAQEPDSLLLSAAEIKNDQVKKPVVHVEFWHSPVNFKGYKFDGRHLLTYGPSPEDDLDIYVRRGMYFLMWGDQMYRLERRDDFSPFQKIDREEFLQQ